MTETYLTPQQVADLLNVSARTVREMARRGELKHLRLNKKCIRIQRSDLETWISNRTEANDLAEQQEDLFYGLGNT